MTAEIFLRCLKCGQPLEPHQTRTPGGYNHLECPKVQPLPPGACVCGHGKPAHLAYERECAQCKCELYRECIGIAKDSSDAEIDAVNHPPHYAGGGVEVIDAIEAWGLGFHLGNAVKYISRAGKKAGADPVEDIKKAIWYLERWLKECA